MGVLDTTIHTLSAEQTTQPKQPVLRQKEVPKSLSYIPADPSYLQRRRQDTQRVPVWS